jgi:probable phosphoglycerate mutase
MELPEAIIAVDERIRQRQAAEQPPPGDPAAQAGLATGTAAQAQAVPGALLDEKISAIYASKLVRTQLTAQPLAEALALDVEVRDGLEEVSAGDLELRSDLDAVHTYAGCLVSWMSGDLDRRTPGGSSGHEFVGRYGGAIRSLVDQHDAGDTVAVFSHGAAIRVFTATAAGLHPDVSTEMRIMNTGMSVLEGDPDTGWELVRWSSEPLGGLDLEDLAAHDVTGESADDAVHES